MSPKPADAPSIPTAKRLEFVRDRLGIGTIRGFLDRLTNDGDYVITYDTARRYHRDREAPAKYLLQVSKVFFFDILWLISGEGYPTEAERLEAEAKAKEGLPDWAQQSGLTPPDPSEEGANAIRAAIASEGSNRPAPRRNRELDDGEDLLVARVTGPGVGNTRTRTSILEGLRAGLGVELRDPSLAVLETIFWRRWSAREEYLPEDKRPSVRELARGIGEAAVAPIKALGIDPQDLEEFEVEAFLPSMYSPLLQVARVFSTAGHEGEPVDA